MSLKKADRDSGPLPAFLFHRAAISLANSDDMLYNQKIFK